MYFILMYIKQYTLKSHCVNVATSFLNVNRVYYIIVLARNDLVTHCHAELPHVRMQGPNPLPADQDRVGTQCIKVTASRLTLLLKLDISPPASRTTSLMPG